MCKPLGRLPAPGLLPSDTCVGVDPLAVVRTVLGENSLDHHFEVVEVGQREEVARILVGHHGLDLTGSVGVVAEADGEGVDVGALL